MFTVMVNADIHNIDALACQNRGDYGYSAGFVHNVNREGVVWRDGAL